MREIIIFLILCLAECAFTFMSIWKKKELKRERSAVRLRELAAFVLCFLLGILSFSFSYYLLLGYLIVNALAGIFLLAGKGREKDRSRIIQLVMLAGRLLLITIVMIPCFLFPDFTPMATSGKYEVGTVSYTWTDESRLEEFLEDGSKRQVSVQFWYPEGETEEFPLVVFSHGAFGFRMSNYSTFRELASNGYVVCSVEHPYHAIFSAQSDGSVVMADSDFVKSVGKINEEGTPEEDIFRITRPWIKLRTDDLNFVIDSILEKTKPAEETDIFAMVDTEKIGVMGHSLGGAAAVTVGRTRSDVDAVINLDATMLGEELACENGEYTIWEEPYPVPLLCMEPESHFTEGQSYGDRYVNNVVLENAKDGKELHFYQAGHMNFTDLPLFSPFLAKMLGIGEVDIRYCINAMNDIVLDYYNYYLKGKGTLESLKGEPGKIERGC